MSNMLPLPTDWKWTKLSDLGLIGRGKSKHRPRYDPVLYGGAYPFIQTGDIKAAGRRLTEYQQTYNERGLAQSRMWPVGTLCITIAANIAETTILGIDCCFPDSVVGFIANANLCDVNYVYYYLNHAKAEVQRFALGSVQDNINLQILEQFPIATPPLSAQHRIAEILGALDDKMECNCRINQTLEQMAQALYKHWFVDFGPFREGEVVDSELGPIPEGWEAKPILSGCELLSGGTPKTTKVEYWNGNIPWVTAKDVSQNEVFIMDTERKVTSLGVEKSATKVLPKGTVVVVARGSVGQFGILGADMAINQTCYGMRGKNGIGQAWVYLTLANTIKHLRKVAYGTVFDTITTTTFQQTKVIFAPEDIMQAFDIKAAPLLEEIRLSLMESRALAHTRDYLLPKLLSGQVAMKTAEKQVEAAV